MDRDGVIKCLRLADDVDFNKERFDHLVDSVGLYHRRAGALILSEQGYSHTGIASVLGVNGSTAKGYLDDLDEEFGEYVTQSHPKYKKYPQLHP